MATLRGCWSNPRRVGAWPWHPPSANSETCTSCGKCVRACTTGALTRKGTGVAEMQKDAEFLQYLSQMRNRENA